jgi:ubiquinone/menaquinone biosynthesis C-methylase UbiE
MNKSEKIKKLYNACYEGYDEHMTQTGHYIAQEKVLNLMIDQISEPILDLACGTGFLIKLLSRKFSKIFGNDFSLEMAKIARRNSKLIITNDNAETLSSYNQKFKTIICCNLFFYLQDRERAIGRWKELLDSDGKIILIEEFPFIKPKGDEMSEHSKELMNLIDVTPLEDIGKLLSQNKFHLIKKIKIKIDEKHNLHGLVFSSG